MSTRRPSPGRADPSENILIPWMRLPGVQPARPVPKFISRSDPAAQWTALTKDGYLLRLRRRQPYLVDLKAAGIVDVEATGHPAGRGRCGTTVIEGTEDCLGEMSRAPGLPTVPTGQPRCWAGWSTSGRSNRRFRCSTSRLRDDGTFARRGFNRYDQEADIYVCPAGKVLTSNRHSVGLKTNARLLYRANRGHDCDACELKPRCCPKMPARKVPRSICSKTPEMLRAISPRLRPT